MVTMDKRRLRTPSPATVIALLALAVALSGVAVAAIPGGDGSARGCYSQITGALRIVDEGVPCLPTEVAINLAATDAAGRVADAQKLDGKDSTEFLAAGQKATDSELLDGMDSTEFLGAGAKAADSELLDGKDSAEFLGAGDKAADADKLDGKDSTDFLAANGKAADADKLDGKNSSDFLAADGKAADADKLDGLGTMAVARESKTGFGPHTVTVTCPDDGVAVRGNHSAFVAQVSNPQYTRSSYSVSAKMGFFGNPFDPRFGTVPQSVVCLTSPAASTVP